MSQRRRAVLGFVDSVGRVGFDCTSAPLVYLCRARPGVNALRHLADDAALRWVICTANRAAGDRLRDALNRGDRAHVLAVAAALSAPRRTVAELSALAFDHANAIDGGDLFSGTDATWKVLEACADAASDPVELASLLPPSTSDCPFSPLPTREHTTRDVPREASRRRRAVALAIFDLDGTLLDTSALAVARDAGRLDFVRSHLTLAQALPSWGAVAPHELPGRLRSHGTQIAVVTRSPRWYADALIERFAIEADHVIAPCGANKTEGFAQAIACAGSQGPPDTLVFGDDRADFTAANNLGCWALGNPWATQMSHRVMPDIAWWDAETLLGNDGWAPELGYIGEIHDGFQPRWHRGSLLPIETDAWALGRYFPSHRGRHRDALTQAIIAQKAFEDRIPRIATAFDATIDRLNERTTVDAVVSAPPRPGGVDRFRHYRARVARVTAAMDTRVTTTREVPSNYKSLAAPERVALRDGRFAAAENLNGATVLVIDDVMTSGSTIGALTDAVEAAGAARVLTLVFAANQPT